MARPVIHFYEFGPFRLAPADRLLLRHDQPVPLAPKLFDILVVLVVRHGRMLAKDELMQAVWPDAFVEEGNLTRNVSTLRKALGEGEHEQQYIETVPKHGYRFVAEVREFGNEDVELAVRERIRASVLIEEEETNGQVEAEAELASFPIRQNKRWTSVGWSWRKSAVAVVGLMLSVTYWWQVSRAKQAAANFAVKSIAVLPFKPLSADDNNQALGLGIADALITDLGGFRRITVRPASAVYRYAGLQPDLLAAGRDLKVEAVLEGGIQRSGEQLRLTAWLVHVPDGRLMWADKFDGTTLDIFALQDALSERVARVLGLIPIGEMRKPLAMRQTDNIDAYQAYANGRYYWNKRTDEGLRQSIRYFEVAIGRDPGYAPGYAGLADAYSILTNYGRLRPKEGFPKAEVLVRKALALDEKLGEAHASLAKILNLYDWQWEEAEREFQRAIELKPGYATAHQWYGEYLISVGRLEEAKAELKQALELDPNSLAINIAQGFPFYYGRQYDQAIAAYRKALELDPNFAVAHIRIMEAYQQQGMFEQALAELDLRDEMWKGWREKFSHAYALSGSRGYWRIYADMLKVEFQEAENTQKSKLMHYVFAQAYACLGENDEAFQWLEKAYEERDHRLGQCLKVDPALDGLHSDPRFADLLRRVGLAP